MKKIILILALFPLTGFTSNTVDSPNLTIFKNKCKNETDPAQRRLYCKLVEQQQKGEAIVNEFQTKK